MEFRELNACEIECRIGQISRSGSSLTLLLYKNARTDADILDETVGAENWQCEFYEQKGTLFCRVGILIAGGTVDLDNNGMHSSVERWVWKSDAGAPSNMEAQKGEASDAFKRACFKWGIGRELYTAPQIRIGSKFCRIQQGSNGKYVCYDTFSVAKIKYHEGEIVGLAIRNDDMNRIAYTYVKDGFGREENGSGQ